tara:strand:+ start:20008 stop:21591 length:1584 start_codon:yes stop_codon:yes gene_type:complete
MSDVTLSASVRQSLLSLQNTTGLVERTQGRLSTGLRVGSAIDDPVAFFQAKSLSDRSSDFLEKKDGIDQGISTVTAALDGVEAIESLVKQMKGVANSMKSATDAQISDLVTQFNDLRDQVNNLATDATYQGTNLINGTGQTVSIEFSEKTASLLNIGSVDLRTDTTGLNVGAASYYTGDNNATNAAITNTTLTAASNTFTDRFITTTTGTSFSVSFQGSDKTFTAGETVAFTYGTGSTFNFVVGTASALTVTQGAALSVGVVTSTTGIGSNNLALVATAQANAAFGYSAQAFSASTTGVKDSVTLTYNGSSAVTLTTADSAQLQFTLGTATVTLGLTSGTTLALTQGGTVTIEVFSVTAGDTTPGFPTAAALTGSVYASFNVTGATTAATYTITAASTSDDTAVYGVQFGGTTTAITANGGEFSVAGLLSAGNTTEINLTIDQLDSALTTLRTQSQTLGANVALLNTRLDFTEQYTNTLTEGSDKLTLADINEEGANLLALQTRQQLGIQALSLAAQAEASILQLFG